MTGSGKSLPAVESLETRRLLSVALKLTHPLVTSSAGNTASYSLPQPQALPSGSLFFTSINRWLIESRRPDRIQIESPPLNLTLNQNVQMKASVLNRLNLSVNQPIMWSLEPGSIGSIDAYSGLFRTGQQPGSATLRATAAGLVARTTVEVVDAAPVISGGIWASESSVSGDTVALSVWATDDGGRDGLSYTWSVLNSPAGASPVFVKNGTTDAAYTSIAFDRAGNYDFQVLVSDGRSQSASTLSVDVDQKLTTLHVPPLPIAYTDSTYSLSAEGRDQFGRSMSNPATIDWTHVSGVGSVSPMGVFKTGLATGLAVLLASAGDLTAQATIPVTKKTAPVLIPGTGFTGATAEPAPIGRPDQAGYDAKAIARWDVVPYQTFDGLFNVGVVAFHMNGIEKVSFSVNGGDWTDVHEMTLNPQTANHSGIGNQSDGVVEYWATLDASKFQADGAVEVRAIAWPTVGEPRVLETLMLNVDAGEPMQRQIRWVSPTGSNEQGDGSKDNPFATIKQAAVSIQAVQGNADNGVIYLLPGEYGFSGGGSAKPKTEHAWLTLSAAPGHGPADVRISSGGTNERLNTKLIRLHNLTLAAPPVSDANLAAELWYDGVIGTRDNRFAELGSSGFAQTWATGSSFHNVRKGYTGSFARNVNVAHTGEDGFFGPSVLINVSVDDVNRAGWEAYRDLLQGAPHPDVVQWHAGAVRENIILYGMTTSNIGATQGLFMKDADLFKDVALVNLQVHADNTQFHVAFQHLLIQSVDIRSQVIFRDDALLSSGRSRNIRIQNSIFGSLAGGVDASGSILVDANRFISGRLWGSNAAGGLLPE